MHEDTTLLDEFAERHAGDVPGVADPASLARVRALALARTEGRAPRTSGRLVWRVAGGVALVAAAVALAFAMTPRQSRYAFAADRAAAALRPTKGVLHTRAHFTETGTTEQFGETPVRRMTCEDWRDFERGLMRSEYRESDGSISELGVVVDGVYRVMASQFRLDLEKKAYVRVGVDEIVDQDAGDMLRLSGAGPVEAARAGLLTGDAVVKGEPIIEGEACWEVELTADGDSAAGLGPPVMRVVFSKSDYRPMRFESSISGVNGNGRFSSTSTLVYEVWETLTPEELPADLFSLDAPVKAARPGTVIQKR